MAGENKTKRVHNSGSVQPIASKAHPVTRLYVHHPFIELDLNVFEEVS